MQSFNKKLLIVEDDPGLQSQLKWCFDEYELFLADNRSAAMDIVRREKPSVVITDLGLPPDPGGSSEGFALLEDVMAFDGETKVIVVTGREEQANAVKAIGLGAYDYYQKPIEIETLKFVVNRAFHLRELEIENQKFIRSQALSLTEGMIGSSPQMLQVMRTTEKVAATSANLLILGESGTGKGMLAKRLHALSDRAESKFVTINCTSIPETLLESELFGHEKGAFTGAVGRKIGKFEYADGGTLFLDEIGDMPLALQAKILHVLQEKTIVRLGGVEEIPLDVRVLCATHQDLKQRIKEGLFREDLYYRVSEIVVEIPPLRDRSEDIMLLAQSFLQKFSEQQGKKSSKFSQDAMVALRSYQWPGNIRELENKIKRGVVMSERALIGVADIDLEFAGQDYKPVSLSEIRTKAESEAIIKTLNNCKNMSEAARLLGITRPTLYSLINKYQLESYIAANQMKSQEL